MSLTKYDDRRFRTLVDITIPAGTLVLPNPSGSGMALSPDTELTVTISDLTDAERRGMLRQLGGGEA